MLTQFAVRPVQGTTHVADMVANRGKVILIDSAGGTLRRHGGRALRIEDELPQAGSKLVHQGLKLIGIEARYGNSQIHLIATNP
ncbi:hypothetical protein [Lamprocystis purpurea]|uniref:hypothetical protein n=1 Tax=Lamprocystis purpurea TaxID=61598 RepID=UPI0012FB7AA2|nr:hypothetical protein [Lamprocystis purpurea]